MPSLKIEDPARVIYFVVAFVGCVVLIALDKMSADKLTMFAAWLLPSPVAVKPGE